MQTMMFHLARPEDLDSLMPVIRDFHRHFGFNWDEDGKRRLLARFLGRPELGRLWVATLDGRVAGYALVPFYFSLEFDGTVALVDEFYLVPKYRGQGAGGRLLREILAGLRADGIGVVRLEVDGRHPEASTLYARLGFVRDGREAWTKRFEIAKSQ